jgi:alkanesulfonate monooxygenase SsuD/methylene tetrahydromethanopterin reductase-like flavin-dependent oxidoreductase (luciferase family)
VRADLAAYRKLHPDGRASFTLAVYCEDDHRAARRRAEPGLQWVYRRLLQIARPMLERQLQGYEDYRRLGWLAPALDRMVNVPLLERLGLAAVGDPAHVARRLLALQQADIDRVSLAVGGGDLSREETTRCVALIAREVMPILRGATVSAPRERQSA